MLRRIRVISWQPGNVTGHCRCRGIINRAAYPTSKYTTAVATTAATATTTAATAAVGNTAATTIIIFTITAAITIAVVADRRQFMTAATTITLQVGASQSLSVLTTAFERRRQAISY